MRTARMCRDLAANKSQRELVEGIQDVHHWQAASGQQTGFYFPRASRPAYEPGSPAAMIARWAPSMS